MQVDGQDVARIISVQFKTISRLGVEEFPPEGFLPPEKFDLYIDYTVTTYVRLRGILPRCGRPRSSTRRFFSSKPTYLQQTACLPRTSFTWYSSTTLWTTAILHLSFFRSNVLTKNSVLPVPPIRILHFVEKFFYGRAEMTVLHFVSYGLTASSFSGVLSPHFSSWLGDVSPWLGGDADLLERERPAAAGEDGIVALLETGGGMEGRASEVRTSTSAAEAGFLEPRSGDHIHARGEDTTDEPAEKFLEVELGHIDLQSEYKEAKDEKSRTQPKTTREIIGLVCLNLGMLFFFASWTPQLIFNVLDSAQLPRLSLITQVLILSSWFGIMIYAVGVNLPFQKQAPPIIVVFGCWVGREVDDTEKTLRIHTEFFILTVFLLAIFVVVCWYM